MVLKVETFDEHGANKGSIAPKAHPNFRFSLELMAMKHLSILSGMIVTSTIFSSVNQRVLRWKLYQRLS